MSVASPFEKLGRPVRDEMLVYCVDSLLPTFRPLRDGENDEITVLARSKNKRAGNPLEAVKMPPNQFLQRWCWHILPQGFAKVRYYGGYHGSCRENYLHRCRDLSPPPNVSSSDTAAKAVQVSDETGPKTP